MRRHIPGLVVDGQRQPEPPPFEVRLLDDLTIDRRTLPLPEVIEHASMAPFYFAGGWVDTVIEDPAE